MLQLSVIDMRRYPVGMWGPAILLHVVSIRATVVITFLCRVEMLSAKRLLSVAEVSGTPRGVHCSGCCYGCTLVSVKNSQIDLSSAISVYEQNRPARIALIKYAVALSTASSRNAPLVTASMIFLRLSP